MDRIKKWIKIETAIHSIYLKVREIRKETEVEITQKLEKRKRFIVIDGEKKD